MGLERRPFFQPPEPAAVPNMYPELERLDLFDSVERQRFEIPRSLSTEAYVGWLSTDSLVLSLKEVGRRGFLHDIEQLIDTHYHGHASRNFVYEIVVAFKTA